MKPLSCSIRKMRSVEQRRELIKFVENNWDQCSRDLILEEAAKRDPNHVWLLAYSAGELVGCIGLYTKNWSWELSGITWLLVHKEHRGKKVGELLVRSAVSSATSEGCALVQLSTQSPAYYRKFDFTTIAEVNGFTYMQLQLR